MTRLLDCLRWLGALSLRELAHALQRTIPTVRRLLTRAKIRQSPDGLYRLRSTPYLPPSPSPVELAIAACLDGEPVYAEWLCERTGYAHGAIYAALRRCGYTARRGRGAVWVLA